MSDDEPKFTEEELANSKRIFKSATPKYTLDWYVKWIASIMVLFAMAFRSVGGYAEYDLVLSFFGCVLWLWVSLLWQDRALIVLNAAAATMLAGGLISHFIPGTIQ
jgi:hypothetical protein